MGKLQSVQCYHCGTLLAKPSGIYVQIGEHRHMVCCYGCQSVVSSLVAVGCYPIETFPQAKPDSPILAIKTCACGAPSNFSVNL